MNSNYNPLELDQRGIRCTGRKFFFKKCSLWDFYLTEANLSFFVIFYQFLPMVQPFPFLMSKIKTKAKVSISLNRLFILSTYTYFSLAVKISFVFWCSLPKWRISFYSKYKGRCRQSDRVLEPRVWKWFFKIFT